MSLDVETLDRLVMPNMYHPAGGIEHGHEQTVFVIAGESPVMSRQLANAMGAAVLGFVRPGVDGDIIDRKKTRQDVRLLTKALSAPDGYEQIAHSAGYALHQRLSAAAPNLTRRIAAGRGRSAMFLAAMLSGANTLGAYAGVLLDPAGIDSFAGTPQSTHTERQVIDDGLYRCIARGDPTLNYLKRTNIPVAVEISEHGPLGRPGDLRVYTKVIEPRQDRLITRQVRPKVTGEHYNHPHVYARAVFEARWVQGLLRTAI